MVEAKFETKLLKVLDKETIADTKGVVSSSSSTSKGLFHNTAHASSTNTVYTDKVQTITFEESEDHDHFSVKMTNEDFDVPVGKKAAVHFCNGFGIAYLATKKGEVKLMNHLTQNPKASITTHILLFLLTCIPAFNALIYLGNMSRKEHYYENGLFTSSSVEKHIGIIALVILMCGVGLGLYAYIASSLIASGVFVYHVYKVDEKAHKGKLEMAANARVELEKLREQL